jgi:hypothetical protein
MNMIIGGARRKQKKNNNYDGPKKHDKASILARKRERWKVQKEVHETAQLFQGSGHPLNGRENNQYRSHHNQECYNNDHQSEKNKRPFLLPGTLESASPPPSRTSFQQNYNNNNTQQQQQKQYKNIEGRNSNNDHRVHKIGLDEDVLTRLTERIATRLRVELKNEAEEFTKYDEDAKRAVTNKIESFLQNELQQHTCPVCFEPMLPPNKSPMLLFPCGHTFCAECIARQKQIATHKCPFCRAKIERIAINHSLKQLMETFLKKKESIESGQSSVASAFKSGANSVNSSNNNDNNKNSSNQNRDYNHSGSENDNKAAEYMQKCRALKIRSKILKNELEDSKNNVSRLEKQKASCALVMKTLRKEEAKAIEQLEAAKEALNLVREHVIDQNEKMDAIEKEKSECHQKIKLIESTVATIDRDADKAYILLQNFSPGAEVIM